MGMAGSIVLVGGVRKGVGEVGGQEDRSGGGRCAYQSWGCGEKVIHFFFRCLFIPCCVVGTERERERERARE